MEIWANINSDNYVVRVIQIQDEDRSILNSVEDGHAWVDISNSKNGPNFLELGRIYLPEKNAIVGSKTCPSWVLNDETMTWQPPIASPQGEGSYIWDEASLSWLSAAS